MKLDELQQKVKETIRTVPNFPKKGIMFKDITTLLENPEVFSEVMDYLVERYQKRSIDVIAGIESRGFIVASILANKLKKPLILIRKKGKLPGRKIVQEYNLEYGTDSIELHENSIKKEDKVLVIDDLIATAGTMLAAIKLIEKVGGNIIECSLIIELVDLDGRGKIERIGQNVFSLVQFKGD